LEQPDGRDHDLSRRCRRRTGRTGAEWLEDQIADVDDGDAGDLHGLGRELGCQLEGDRIADLRLQGAGEWLRKDDSRWIEAAREEMKGSKRAEVIGRNRENAAGPGRGHASGEIVASSGD